jgi:MFS family permease
VNAPPLRRNRDFMLLQAGQLLSTAGSGISRIAFPLLVLALTGSPAKAGIVQAAEFVPLALFSLPAGVVADRFKRKRVMIAADVVSAAAVAFLAAAILGHHAPFWLISVVAFFDGTAAVFYMAAQSGAFRSVVPRAQLPAAASISQGRAATVRLVGPPLGGALFAVARALPFIVDAVSYAFSTLSVILMRTPFEEERERDPARVRSQLVEGLRFLWDVPFLRMTAMMIGVGNFAVTGAQLVVIVLAKRHGLPSSAIGGFVALIGVTTLLGSFTSPLFRRFLSMRAILLSEFWAASGALTFLIWPNVYVLAIALAAQAFFFPNTDAAVISYRYALTPDRLIGRVVAASGNVAVLAMPLGPLVAGFLLASVPPRATMAVFTGSALCVAVWGTLRLPEASHAEVD